MRSRIFILVLLLVFLPLFLRAVNEGIKLKLGAETIPANIVVDAKGILGPMPDLWRALAQGGEDEGRAELGAITGAVAELGPKYIRIDHIFDAYGLVSRNSSGSLAYNWEELDRVVADILAVGALPFFSLSYMPPAMAKDGNPINAPTSWTDWQDLVRQTIEHFSGKENKNLSGVYYEVWNEPDLFGGWNMGCPVFRIGCDPGKSYKTLYYHSLVGAGRAANVNPFKIGGPATTGAYPSWVDALLNFCLENHLRIDFFSWHRYSRNPLVFEEDIRRMETYLERHPEYVHLEKIISEWGSDSENSSVHDGIFDAAHSIASIRKFLARIDLAFAFEVKDGLSKDGRPFWGRWGLLTHENSGAQEKPRYRAFVWLGRLGPERLSVSGEGTFVSALATKSEERTVLLVVNFDPAGKNLENLPVTFTGLSPGRYHLEVEDFSRGKILSEEITTAASGVIGRMLPLPPHAILLFELSPL
ncbi:hypothetical protein FJZ40_00650 [Candidatus Shapirobacteria bacterium]|nr:hypothetical protein [Candidatus Shapirobacteria bacterium]